MEITASEIRCNACWRVVVGSAFTTSCSHLFDRQCAERFFGQALTCPLCSATLSRDDIVEISAARPTTAAFFGYAVFHLADVLRAVGEAVAFSRAQTALYGTREVWVKAKEGDTARRRLVEVSRHRRECVNVRRRHLTPPPAPLLPCRLRTVRASSRFGWGGDANNTVPMKKLMLSPPPPPPSLERT